MCPSEKSAYWLCKTEGGGGSRAVFSICKKASNLVADGFPYSEISINLAKQTRKTTKKHLLSFLEVQMIRKQYETLHQKDNTIKIAPLTTYSKSRCHCTGLVGAIQPQSKCEVTCKPKEQNQNSSHEYSKSLCHFITAQD